MQLSENFSLNEFTKSDTAVRKGIDNTPNDVHLENMKALCENVLQKVRSHFGKSVRITSGYRSPELCEAIGSSSKSQHAKGQAADFEITGIDNKDLAIWIRDNVDFDQLILEFYTEGDPNSGWVHCSYSDDNRKQVLSAKKTDTGTQYSHSELK
jgi:zinc D-Ala-D-Ala carboxypeptidase